MATSQKQIQKSNWKLPVQYWCLWNSPASRWKQTPVCKKWSYDQLSYLSRCLPLCSKSSFPSPRICPFLGNIYAVSNPYSKEIRSLHEFNPCLVYFSMQVQVRQSKHNKRVKFHLLLFSCSIVSDCLATPRVFCSWDFPDNNTGMGCHFHLQGIFLTQGSCTGRRILYHWATWEAPHIIWVGF